MLVIKFDIVDFGLKSKQWFHIVDTQNIEPEWAAVEMNFWIFQPAFCRPKSAGVHIQKFRLTASVFQHNRVRDFETQTSACSLSVRVQKSAKYEARRGPYHDL